MQIFNSKEFYDESLEDGHPVTMLKTQYRMHIFMRERERERERDMKKQKETGKCKKVLKLEPNVWQWLYKFQDFKMCGSWNINV